MIKALAGRCSDCGGASIDPLKGAVSRCRREKTRAQEAAS
jgi:hypothetical protein